MPISIKQLLLSSDIENQKTVMQLYKEETVQDEELYRVFLDLIKENREFTTKDIYVGTLCLFGKYFFDYQVYSKQIGGHIMFSVKTYRLEEKENFTVTRNLGVISMFDTPTKCFSKFYREWLSYAQIKNFNKQTPN